MGRGAAAAALAVALASCGGAAPGPPSVPAVPVDPPPGPARAAAEEIRPILALYRDEPPGPGRAELLADMAEPLRRFMEEGGGFAPLALLAAAADEGATARERRLAFEALPHPFDDEVVDWLLDRARCPRADVRLLAVRRLAVVPGAARRRALAAVERALRDPDPSVRASAADAAEWCLLR